MHHRLEPPQSFLLDGIIDRQTLQTRETPIPRAGGEAIGSEVNLLAREKVTSLPALRFRERRGEVTQLIEHVVGVNDERVIPADAPDVFVGKPAGKQKGDYRHGRTK